MAGVQNENAVLHQLSGHVVRPETSGLHCRIKVIAPSVGEGGRAAATGFRVLARVAAGRHRVTDSPRPRQQARPELCILQSLKGLATILRQRITFSFCTRRDSPFELPPTLCLSLLAPGAVVD